LPETPAFLALRSEVVRLGAFLTLIRALSIKAAPAAGVGAACATLWT
jgi:hypothetical protein